MRRVTVGGVCGVRRVTVGGGGDEIRYEAAERVGAGGLGWRAEGGRTIVN